MKSQARVANIWRLWLRRWRKQSN